MPRPERLLIVGTGAPGGIGRVEQLVAEAALDAGLAPAKRTAALWRRRHPEYLYGGAIKELASVSTHLEGAPGSYVADLVRAIRTARPDYVMYMHVNLARPAPWLHAVGHPARFGVWTYGIEIWPRLSKLHRHALSRAEAVMTISADSVRRTVETQDVSPERVHLVPLSLPQAMFRSDRPTPGTEGSGRLLTVSRLAETERGKNIEELIAAMATVRRAHAGAHLVIVGDGDARERLEGLAREHGVADLVTFTGRLSDDELQQEYRKADLFVLPSEKEGFGLVFVEAMLTGTPVLGLARGGPLDIVRDGVDGRLIQDVDELPQALCAMLGDQHALNAMGRHARLRAVEGFSPEVFRSALRACLDPVGPNPMRPL